jgi:hypothetical protein
MSQSSQREERIEQSSQNLISARAMPVTGNIISTEAPSSRTRERYAGEVAPNNSQSFFITFRLPQTAYIQAWAQEANKNYQNLVNAIRSKNPGAIKTSLIEATRNLRTSEAQKQAINSFNKACVQLGLPAEKARQLWEEVDYPFIEETMAVEDDTFNQSSSLSPD